MEKQILQEILDFMEKAGALALENQATAQNELKADNSIVTEIDLAISKMAHQMFAHWLEKEDHILIDEESIDQIGTPEEVFANSTYQWVLDPIDGTAHYAAGMDCWGILLAVLNEGAPLVSVMYFPKQETIHYATSEAWIKIKYPFSQQEKREDPVYKKEGAIFSNNSLWAVQQGEQRYLKDYPKKRACIIASPYTPLEMIWTLEGKNVGKLGEDYIWDSAGILAFSQHSSAKLWDIKSEKQIKRLKPKYFTDTWYWKKPYLESTQENLRNLKPYIKEESYI